MKADLEAISSPFGAPIVVLSTIDSTSEEIRRRAAAGAPAGLVVVADAQTAGRGRRGHSWHSPPGAGLYLSMLLRPMVPAADLVVLPLLAGLATWRTVASFDLSPVWKWPNDVFVGGKKIAGVLVESSSGPGGVVDVAVVGIGINVADVPMPKGLVATSLAAVSGRSIGRADVAGRLVSALAATIRSGIHPAGPGESV